MAGFKITALSRNLPPLQKQLRDIVPTIHYGSKAASSLQGFFVIVIDKSGMKRCQGSGQQLA
jgi:hypothetical protein